MFGRNLSVQEKRLAMITLIVACIYVLYLAVYLPFRKKEASLEKRIRSAEQKLSQSSNVIQQSEVWGQRYKSALDNFKQSGSDEQVMSALLAQIENAANQVNMSIADLKPRRVKSADFYKNFSVSVATEGKLKDIVRFVSILQTTPHLLDVEEIHLNKTQTSGSLRCQLVFSKTVVSDKEF